MQHQFFPGQVGPALNIQRAPDDLVFSLSTSRAGSFGPPPVEWWFFQGWYEGTRTGKRFFMCTLFRFLHQAGQADLPLYHLLVSELNPVTGENVVISQADPAISRWMEGDICSNLDPDLVRAYQEELRENGVPSPMTTGSADPSVTGNPFSINWGDFTLDSLTGTPVLTFPHPGDRDICRFVMEPVVSAWFCPGVAGMDKGGMAYASIPRLEIRGTVGNEQVTGEVWADHQWGGVGWFQNSSPGTGGENIVLGWDWYAINLDSGVDLMILAHRDMATRMIRVKWGVIIEKNGQIIVPQDFTLEQSGIWTSPVTGISYPLVAKIIIPGYDCNLQISPLVPDQEIPVPGPMRAIWEGVGRVEGTVKGYWAGGTARIELCGYGYIFDFEKILSSISQKIDDEITRFLPPVLDEGGIARLLGCPQWEGDCRVYRDMIAGPTHELMQRSKKYFRPLYAILLLHALGVDSEPYFDLISTIPELTHTGALIIDDIEDGSHIRRGGPCIHISYGVDTAINAANTLYYLPWLLVEHHPFLTDTQRLRLYQDMVRSAVKAHIGQGADIYRSHHASSGQILAEVASQVDKKVLQMHADKTGVAGEQVANACCIIACSPQPVSDACIRYSRCLWIAFQIVDDIRDIIGGSEWYKVPGGDIASGKLSYVIVKALMMLQKKKQERLAQILATPPGYKEEHMIREGISLVRESGAIEVCRQEVVDMVNEEWKQLSGVIPPSESKTMLWAFSRRMLRE